MCYLTTLEVTAVRSFPQRYCANWQGDSEWRTATRKEVVMSFQI